MAESITQEALIITGMAGATAASRYAGATTFGAPTTGTFAVGDYVVDQSGAMYVCIVAGTPGTWQLSGVSINENIAGKNFVINGGMDIAQRGTSFTIGNSTSYTLDRWSTSGNASSAYTVSQISSGLTGFQYAMRSQRNSGATSTANFSIGQSLETKNSIPLAGQTVTLSFWARVGSNYSGASGQLIFYAAWGTGTDQNFQNGGYTGQTQIAKAYFTPTTSWQRFSYTGTVGSSATQVALEWYYAGVGTAGANDYFDITGVQLEIAPQATPFSRTGGSIGGELALCQRYYWRNTTLSSNTPIGLPGIASSATLINYVFQLPVTMRTYPALVETSGLQAIIPFFSSSNLTYNNINATTYNTISISFSGTGMTGTLPYFLYSNASNSYIGIGAEL